MTKLIARAVAAAALIGAQLASPFAILGCAASKTTPLTVDVRTYGANPNDGVDDRAAINAASNAVYAAGGGTLLFGAGTYDVSDTILLNSKVTYQGAGPGATIIKQITTNSPVAASRNYFAAQGISPTGHMRVKGIQFQGSPTIGSNNHGLVVRDYYTQVEDVLTTSTGGNGIHFTTRNDAATAIGSTLVENWISRCQVRSPVGIGIYVGETDNNKLTDGWLSDCLVEATSTTPNHVYIGSVAGWQVRGVHTYGSAPTGASMELRNGYNTRVEGCYIECFGTHAIALNSGQRNITVANCTVKLGPASGAGIFLSKSAAVSSFEATVSGSHFQNDGSNATLGIQTNTGTITLYVSSNSFVNTGAGSVTPYTLPSMVKLRKANTETATAVPTTGTYSRGDIVWNNTPSTTGAIGWICTAAGTPGTWKDLDFVDLANAQTILGAKTFSSAPTFSTALSIASGGTGSATRNFVDLTSDEAVGGVKTFSSAPVMSGAGITAASVPDSALSSNVALQGAANTFTLTQTVNRTAQASTAEVWSIWKNSDDSGSQIQTGNNVTTDGVVEPKFSMIQGSTRSVHSLFQSTTDTGTNPIHQAIIRIGSATTAVTRPLSRLYNNATQVYNLAANGDLTWNGNVIFGDLGEGIQLKEGSNARMGTATLVGGTVTVSNTGVTANTRIYLTKAVGGGTRGTLEVGTVTPGTSFVIKSVDSAGSLVADTSTVNWLLIEPSP